MTDETVSPPLPSDRPARRPDIDWLRAIAVLLLVPFHASLIFCGAGGFHISTGEDYQPLMYFAGILSQWHMPLLFVISGVSTWFALNVRTPGRYATERVKRLLVPLVFGTLVIIPPQVYLERISRGQFDGSYLSFYPHFFEGVYPSGNFSYHHLWFVAYLLVFSLLALPVFVRLRRGGGRSLTTRLATVCEKRGGILLFALPLAVTESLFRAAYPGLQTLISDWANFTGYLYLFILGFVICCDPRFWPAIRRDGGLALIGGLVVLSIGVGLNLAEMNPARGYSLGWTLYMVLKAFNCWFWIVAILSAGMKLLNFSGRLLPYVRQASYPFYILHQTILITIGYHVMHWHTSVMARYLTVVTATTIVTMLVYDLAVRRADPIRFLFGMRSKSG